ncbi:MULTISPECIES: MFS transporter [Burkholderia]|uniref:MFS transporter n=1 Tax=Burkholderia TaxID=32008 RepID=UPI0008421ECD|nr:MULTISPECIES: MFS transporter [unclassified Burkholderia]AOK28443.1 MFS transporter [Burkholderia sp. Bp7605]
MSTTSADTASTAATGPALTPLLIANFAMMAGSYAFFAVAAPLARLLNLQASHMGAIIAVVGLVWVATARRWGRLADLRGRVPVMRIAMAGFTASYLLLALYVGWALRARAPALALSVAVLLATRAAMGGYFAALPVAAFAWIADRTAPHARAAAMARFGAAGALGMVIAPPVAGWIAGHDMAAMLAVFALLPLAGWPGLGRLRDTGPRERRDAPARLKIADARIRKPWLCALMLYSVIGIANSAFGFYVIDRLHVPARQAAVVAGYALGSAGLGMIAMQSVVGRLPSVAPLQWLRWGALAGAAGFASVLLVGPAQPMAVCVSYLVAACGMGASFPAVAALASAAVDAREQGACAGAMSTAQGLSMVAAPLIGAALYDWRAQAPFVVIGGMLLMVCGATWPRTRRMHAQP